MFRCTIAALRPQVWRVVRCARPRTGPGRLPREEEAPRLAGAAGFRKRVD